MAEVRFEQGSTINEDTACIGCGYYLRGLPYGSSCPECATPIARSLHGNLLRYADPSWLEQLRKGTSVKLWNIGLMIVTRVITGVVVIPQERLILVTILGGILGLWAAYLITAQEPRISLEESTVTLRNVVRTCAVVAFIGTVLQQTAYLAVANRVVPIIGSFLGIAVFVQLFGELVYFRRFARRIPDGELEKSTTVVLWGFPISFACFILGGRLAALFSPGGGAPLGYGGPPAAAGAAIMYGGGVALLVFALGYVRLLTSYKKAFTEAVRYARSTATEDLPA